MSVGFCESSLTLEWCVLVTYETFHMVPNESYNSCNGKRYEWSIPSQYLHHKRPHDCNGSRIKPLTNRKEALSNDFALSLIGDMNSW